MTINYLQTTALCSIYSYGRTQSKIVFKGSSTLLEELNLKIYLMAVQLFRKNSI